MPKILFLDIETSPKIAYVWRFWKENVGAKQVIDHGHIMSYAAAWGDNGYASYEENRGDDDSEITKKLIVLLDEADIVVGHNVDRFDCNTINGRALVLGINPPSPYKIVDTYQVAKTKFKFESNSLEYLAKVLGCENQKLNHAKFPGFLLWLECLKGNNEAWKEMKRYNIMDTFTVRDVYRKMRPWIPQHPNIGVFLEQGKPVCPKCGSEHIKRRGYAHTQLSKFQRFVCMDCGGWSRTRFNEYDKDKRKQLLANAV
jgi:predicted RNA-binding Zn-ribbon protein involved in translation (DUF1610 family)